MSGLHLPSRLREGLGVGQWREALACHIQRE